MRRWRWVLLIICALGCLGVLIWSSVVAYAASDLVHQLAVVQDVVDSGAIALDVESTTAMVNAVRRDIVILDRYAGWLARVATLYRWVPKVGPWMAQAPALLELADALTDLGQRLWHDVAPAVAGYQQGESVQRLLPQALAAVSDELVLKQESAGRAQVAYADLEVEVLPSRLRGPLAQLGTALPWLPGVLDFAAAAPAHLGMEGPRTYLVLALNEDELRPGGGFITGVGQVEMVDGQIGSMVFQDSYAADDFTQPYPDPPAPMRQFLGADLLVLRDSNWSPDFPTAARQAIELYRPAASVVDEIAGVIALDQQAVQILLGSLGSVQIEGTAEPITADTVLGYMHDAWAPDDGSLDGAWWAQRKSFMSDLASAVLRRVESGQVDLSALGRALAEALNGRHIQLYLQDAVAAALPADLGWDGGLHVPEGDFLALVEANLGYNKASTMVARRVDYEIDLREASLRAEALLHFVHLSDREQACQPEVRYDPVYEDMMHRCYWAHLRLFVPPGASLLGATHSPIPANLVFTGEAWQGDAEVAIDGGATVFSQAMLLPTQGEQSLRFSYLLPDAIVFPIADGSMMYRLQIRKQAGLATLPGSVTLRLPQNAVVLAAYPNGFENGSGLLYLAFDSRVDVEISVRYRVP